MNLLDLVVSITAKDEASSKIEGLSTKSVAMGTAIGGTLSGLVLSGVQKAGDAIVDFGKESIATGKDFNQAMAEVAATMGTTTDDITELTSFAKEMGATTSFSASEAAGALNYMALAGYDANESMEMLPNVLNLAAAGSMDLKDASDMVTDAQTALGLTFEETTVLVDQMAAASANSNTSVQQLGDAILTIGGTAKNMSGGINEMNTVLGVLADNGIKGSEAGTHLRNIILSLSAPTDVAAGALADLGVSATDMEGNLRPIPDIMQDLNLAMSDLSQEEKTQALNKIFNKTDLASVNALLSTAADNVGEIGQALMDTGVSFQFFDDSTVGAQEQAEGMAAYISNALGVMQGDVELTAQKISEEFGLSFEDAQKLVQATADVAANTRTRYDELGESIANAGFSVSSFKSALSDVGGNFDEIAGSVDKLGISSEQFESILESSQGNAQDFVNTLWEAADAGVSYDDVVGALGISVEDLQTAFDNTAGAAQAMADTKLDTLEGDTKLYESALEGVQIELENGVEPALRSFTQAGAEGLSKMAEELRNGDLVGGFAALGETATSVASRFMEALPSFVDAGMKMIFGFLQGIGQGLPELIPAIVSGVVGMASAIVSNIPVIISAALSLVQGLVTGILQAIPALVETIPTVIEAIVTAFTEGLPALINGAISLVNGIIAALPEIITALVEAIPQIVTALVTGLLEALPVLVEGFVQLFVALVEAVPVLIETLLPMVPQIIESLAKGFIEAAPQIIEAFQELFSKLPEKAQEFLSKVLDNVGKWIGELAENAQKAGSEFLDNVVKFFQELPGKLAEFCSTVIDNIGQWVSDMVENAQKMGSEFLDKVVEFFQQLPGKIAEFCSNIIDNIANWVSDMIDKANEAGSEFLNSVNEKFWEVVNFFGELPGRIIGAFGDFGSMLFNVGRDIIQGLINGIKNMVGSAIQAVTDAVGGIVNAAKNFLGIHSPSTVFASIGDYTMQGLSKGFEEGSEDAANTLEGILDDMSGNTVTVGMKKVNPGYQTKRDFVFNVTINANRDAMDYGRKIGESLYETMKRMELSWS